jgi:proline racemase
VLASLEGRDLLDTGAAAGVNALAVSQSSTDGDRTLVIAPGGLVHRSPRGTGTAARMVLRHHQGDLDVGERYIAESVLGTTFWGRLRHLTRRDGRAAVVPAVTCTTHLVDKQTLLQELDDSIVGFRRLTSRSAAFEFTASEAAGR